jgi:hypothetical protein
MKEFCLVTFIIFCENRRGVGLFVAIEGCHSLRINVTFSGLSQVQVWQNKVIVGSFQGRCAG